MDRHQIRTPPWRVTEGPPASLDFLRARLGERLVVQSARGSGGHGTVLLDSLSNIDDIASVWPVAATSLVSRYISGITVNCHGAVVGHLADQVGPVSVQLGACEALGSTFGQYCGSVFTREILGGDSLAELRHAVRTTARLLRDDEFTGIFGVDAIVDPRGRVHVLEVNIRLQASTWLLAGLESGDGMGGLPAWWLRNRWPDGHDPDRMAGLAEGRSQLCVRYRGAREAEVLSLGDLFAAARGNSLGVEPAVFYSGFPRVGRHLTPGALLCRIASDVPLFNPFTAHLSVHAEKALDLLRRSVKLREIDCGQ